MITFHNVGLQNIIYYDKAELDLDYEGITFITGDNKNAKIKGRRNGAGKTLLISSILGFIYPDIIDQNTLGKKPKHGLFSKENARIEWDLTIFDDRMSLAKFRGKTPSIKWDMIKHLDDNQTEDLNPRKTGSLAESFLRDHFPLSSEDFFSTVYLNSRRPNILQWGTPTQRHQYFTNLFRLHDFERVKQYFQTELKELGQAKVRRDAYMESLSPVSWVASFDLKKAEKLLKDLKDEQSDIKAKIKKLQKIQQQWQLYSRHKDDYKLAQKFVKGEIEALEKIVAQWHRYESYVDVLASYKKKKKRYDESVAQVKSILGSFKGDIAKAWQKYVRKQQQALANYKVDIESWNDLQSDWEEYDTAQAKIKKLKKQLAKLGKIRSVDSIESDIEAIDEQLNHLHEHKGNSCTVCGSKLTETVKVKLIASLEASRKDLEKLLKKAESRQELVDEITDTEVMKPKKKLGDKPVKPEVTKLNPSLDKPTKPKTVDKPDTKLDKLQEQLKELRRIQKAADRCEGIDEKTLKGVGLEDKTKKLDKLQTRLIKVAGDINGSAENIKRFHEDTETYQSIKDKIKKIGKHLKDWPVFEALIDAYGNKGIKIFVMQNISNTITENLNKYSHLLFPEPIAFTAEVDVNTFNLIATRADGTTSDVRDLSGAESSSFTLLWMLGIIPLMPATRRTNLCILDEFEAGLDEPTRKLLIEEFLPQLQMVVPHVIFVTPYLSPVSLSNSRTFCAVKKGSVTKLEAIEHAD